MRARVLIHGWYGNGNLGDEALLEAVLELVREAAPRAACLVTSAQPAATRRELPGVIPVYTRTRFERPLWKVAAWLSSAVIVGGGNLLQEYAEGSSTVADLLGRLEWAMDRGAKAVLLGVGVGDHLSEAGLAALRRVGPRLQGLVVRDRASAQRLKDAGVETNVHVACDLALWWASRTRGAAVPTSPPTLLVNMKGPLPDDAEANRERWELDLLERHLADALRAGHRIVGVPARRTEGPDSDWHSLAKLRDRLDGGIQLLDRPPTPREYLKLCRGAAGVVAGRLHASILAIGAGTPAFGLAYSSKVADFFDDAGLGRCCVRTCQVDASHLLHRFLSNPGATRPLAAGYLERSLDLSDSAYRSAIKSCIVGASGPRSAR